MLSSTTIRPATVADLPMLMDLLHEKADFDRDMGTFSGDLPATPEALQQTLFSGTPFAKVLFAERDRTVVGFALYYFRYSSFQARPSLWLDDLYLQPQVRHQGLGTLLMAHLAQVAQQANSTHCAWTASIHNAPAIRFYERMGGVVAEQRHGLLYFHLDEAAMQALVQPLAVVA